MVLYKLVRLYIDITQTIYIHGTPDQELDLILIELKKTFPAAKTKILQLPDGGIYGFDIEKLGSQCSAAHWWLIQQLCKNYEPFGAVQGGEYSFRRKL
jgi:hypothetical protein